VIGKGELRGIGVVADLTASVKGKVEIMWSGPQAIPALAASGLDPHATGETVRVIVPEEKVDQTIDVLRSQKARLIAVTPMRSTLEDYFVAKLAAPAESAR